MAQERKKRRIVLASILKPVDDTRMLEKMGMSLSNSGLYEVFVVGFPSRSTKVIPGIQLIPLRPFPRISLKRVMAKWEYFRIMMRIKPALVIFSTHELVLPSIILKVLVADLSVIYDVRENYFRNILYGGSFPKVLRWPLAWYVRFKEKLLAPAVNHFFLAERSYEHEFKFHRAGWTVLENKAPVFPGGPKTRTPVPGKLRLLFSGTLAKSTGVYEAIRLAKELHQLDASVSLTIIGHAAAVEDRQRLLLESRGQPFIRLVGGESLVPHEEIMNCIQNSDAGIIIYPRSPHTANSHPTKLFEYLHGQLPIILDRDWPWVKDYTMCSPFVVVDGSPEGNTSLLRKLKTQVFYPTPAANVTWESEEPRLLEALNKL